MLCLKSSMILQNRDHDVHDIDVILLAFRHQFGLQLLRAAFSSSINTFHNVSLHF